MKKLTSQLFKSALMVLGFFAMLSLSSCAGGGQADQDTDNTEEAAPAEEMPADAAEGTEAAADTTNHDGHDHDEEHAEEGDEHPTGGSEHPN